MGISFRKRVRLGKGQALNLSKSGASVSKRFGRVTVNSRGRFSIRIFKGVTYRGGCLIAIAAPLAGLATAGLAVAAIARAFH